MILSLSEETHHETFGSSLQTFQSTPISDFLSSPNQNTLGPDTFTTPEFIADLNFDAFGYSTGGNATLDEILPGIYNDPTLFYLPTFGGMESNEGFIPVPRPLPPAAIFESNIFEPEAQLRRQYGMFTPHFRRSARFTLIDYHCTVSNFIRIHCARYPFLHLPTWSESKTHPLLMRAMVACGALYAAGKSPESQLSRQLVIEILQSDIRHQIFRAFVRIPGSLSVRQNTDHS